MAERSHEANAAAYPINFILAINHTLHWEVGGRKDGGYTNDPHDPGGETRWGISKRYHPDLDIKNLTRERAYDVYYAMYFQKYGLPDIVDPLTSIAVFDCMVNPGPRGGTVCVQQACVNLGEDIAVDGKLGPKTRAALNRLKKQRGDLIAHIAGLRFSYYQERARESPAMARYLRGWTRRAFGQLALVEPDGQVVMRYGA